MTSTFKPLVPQGGLRLAEDAHGDHVFQALGERVPRPLTPKEKAFVAKRDNQKKLANLATPVRERRRTQEVQSMNSNGWK